MKGRDKRRRAKERRLKEALAHVKQLPQPFNCKMLQGFERKDYGLRPIEVQIAAAK